jgi:rhomboid family GlyGly-CTERM serine protease
MQPATRIPNWLDLRGTAITIGVALAVMAVPLIPGGAGWLQFDRLAILDGQWWRLLTGHLTHWNLDHLFWDLLMFVVLGAMVERLSRPRFVLVCLVSAITISLMVLLAQAHLWTYRGLSGIDTALFVYLACDQLTRAWYQRRWGEGLLPASLLAGFGGKLLYELATGSTLFVDSHAAGFVVVVMAHAVGATAGAVLGVMFAVLAAQPYLAIRFRQERAAGASRRRRCRRAVPRLAP